MRTPKIGGGSSSAKNYTPGQLTVGAGLTVTIATGGLAGPGGFTSGAIGRRGECDMSWN